MSHRGNRRRAERAAKDAKLRASSSGERRKILGWVAFLALIFAALGVLLFLSDGPETGLPGGELAPNFSLTDVAGRPFHLSDHRGQVVLLDFMGSRCSSCVLEMPHLVATHDAYAGRGIVMISIDVGGPLGTTDPDVARSFLARYGGTWQIALDSAGVGTAYGVSALPTLYLISKTGTVAFRHAGVITASDLGAQIDALL